MPLQGHGACQQMYLHGKKLAFMALCPVPRIPAILGIPRKLGMQPGGTRRMVIPSRLPAGKEIAAKKV